MEAIYKRVSEIFNVNCLHDYQKQCFEELVIGKDLFVIQPTGSGKSLVFYALPLVMHLHQNSDLCTLSASSEDIVKSCELFVLVVSPLIRNLFPTLQFKNIHRKLGHLIIALRRLQTRTFILVYSCYDGV